MKCNHQLAAAWCKNEMPAAFQAARPHAPGTRHGQEAAGHQVGDEAGERWPDHLPTWPAAAAAPGQHWESTGQPVFQLIPSFRCRRPIFGPWIIGVGGWSGKWEMGLPPPSPSLCHSGGVCARGVQGCMTRYGNAWSGWAQACMLTSSG